MSLVNNNPTMDDELAEIMEGLMREKLAVFKEDQWFTLLSLYKELGIKFTVNREGTLDKIILKTLDEWNWYPHYSKYWGQSYIRRNRPTDMVEFFLVNGTTKSTRYSWPPYSPPEPSPEEKASYEETRQRINRSRNRGRKSPYLITRDGIRVNSI